MDNLAAILKWTARIQAQCDTAGARQRCDPVKRTTRRPILIPTENQLFLDIAASQNSSMELSLRKLLTTHVRDLQERVSERYDITIASMLSLPHPYGVTDETLEDLVIKVFEREFHRSRSLRILEAAYQRKSSLLNAEAVAVANIAGLKPQQVRTWFQNRRNRSRKAHGQSAGLSQSPSYGRNSSSEHDTYRDNGKGGNDDDEYLPSSRSGGRVISRLPRRAGRAQPRSRPVYPPGQNAYTDNTTHDIKGGRRIKAIPKRAHPPKNTKAQPQPATAPDPPRTTLRQRGVKAEPHPSHPVEPASTPLNRTLSAESSSASEVSSIDPSGGFSSLLYPSTGEPTQVVLSETPAEMPYPDLNFDLSFLDSAWNGDIFAGTVNPFQALGLDSEWTIGTDMAAQDLAFPLFGGAAPAAADGAEMLALSAMGGLTLASSADPSLNVSPHSAPGDFSETTSIVPTPDAAAATAAPAQSISLAGFGTLMDLPELDWLASPAIVDNFEGMTMLEQLEEAFKAESGWINGVSPEMSGPTSGSEEGMEGGSIGDKEESERSATPSLTVEAERSLLMATEEIFRPIKNSTPLSNPFSEIETGTGIPLGRSEQQAAEKSRNYSPVEPVSAFSAFSAASTLPEFIGSEASQGSDESAMAALLNLYHAPVDHAGSRVPSWGSTVSATSTRIITPPSGAYRPAEAGRARIASGSVQFTPADDRVPSHHPEVQNGFDTSFPAQDLPVPAPSKIGDGAAYLPAGHPLGQVDLFNFSGLGNASVPVSEGYAPHPFFPNLALPYPAHNQPQPLPNQPLFTAQHPSDHFDQSQHHAFPPLPSSSSPGSQQPSAGLDMRVDLRSESGWISGVLPFDS